MATEVDTGDLPANYRQLLAELAEFIPAAQLISDPLRRIAYGSDASFYRLVPKLVVEAADEAQLTRCLELAARHHTPVTFRAAGSSLSGQAITDSVLLRLGWGWRDYQVKPDGSEIRLQPGVIGGDANRYLAAFQRKIGPDPASIDTAKIGGIAANNASGMCCGSAQNSYQTLQSMRVILADGSLLDSADESSCRRFRESHASLLDGLAQLAEETRKDRQLAKRIRHKFKIKNTTGYSLNALVDFEDPIDILQHLMIGSEGTLGFIAEITYRTVAEHPHKASALAFFADIASACEVVTRLKSAPVAAVELMDRAALRAVEDKPGMPALLKQLPPAAAALLIETRAGEPAELKRQIGHIESAIAGMNSLHPVAFSDIEAQYSRLWDIRKGLFPSVGAMRKTGSTVIIEDVAFPLASLAAATLDLQGLFTKHGYTEAIIFGHALEGNLHFVFTQDFGSRIEVERYHGFMDEVCHLVVHKYDGSLKAEHSTGRNMAPFVELEWGSQAFALMQRIKQLFDPDNLLNPGVILNDDPRVHVSNLKPLPAVDPLIDKCIECGFCEPACPSRALSLTPRQRIVGLREMASLEARGDTDLAEALRRDFQYQGIDTCAGDSLCSIACPVGIDTGHMIKTLRGRQLGKRGQKLAHWVAHHFTGACRGTRAGLGAADFGHGLLGKRLMGGVTGTARKLSGNRVPLWNPYMPTAAPAPQPQDRDDAARDRVVYFASCASRAMGPARGDPADDSLPERFAALLHKAGYKVGYPDALDSLCCGMPFESKGAAQVAEQKLRETEAALLTASRGGRDPVVFDTSPCHFRLRQHLREKLEIFDITEFIHDFLLERLSIRKLDATVAIHPTCSTRKLGLEKKLQAIAETCSSKVLLPDGVSCCGWAGDKGFTLPELNASALSNLPSAFDEDCREGYSTSRSCEIGLSLHSGRYYRSIAYLVDRCSSAKSSTPVTHRPSGDS